MCVYDFLMEEMVSPSTRNITKHTLIETDACIQNSLPYSVAPYLPHNKIVSDICQRSYCRFYDGCFLCIFSLPLFGDFVDEIMVS